MSYFIPLGLLVILFFSLGAGSLKSFSRHKLEEFCRYRHAEACLALILKKHETVAAAVSVALILSEILFFVGLVYYAEHFFTDSASKITIIAIGALIFLFAEFWLPRAVVKLWGTYIVYYAWSLWNGTAILLSPFIFIDQFVTLFFCRLAGHTDDEDAFEEEIRTIVTEGHREGLLEGDARQMIEGVIELQDVSVSEIMTPRTDMRCIADSLSWDEMLQFVISSSHSRIPVYKDTRDDIIGVVHTKNLLRELALKDPAKRRPWTELMSVPLFVPETKPVDTLLQEFQNVRRPADSSDVEDKAKGHLAIVLDEYGGVAGIVTLEDILEEIVGEITDEHDTIIATEEITKLGPETFDVMGKVRIDELNEQLDLHLPDEEDYDTVAGFIFSTLGHVPEVSESIDFDHDGKKVKFTVIAATRRRIEQVRIERIFE